MAMVRYGDTTGLELVSGIEHVRMLARARRSLLWKPAWLIQPAAVFIHWQAAALLKAIDDGELYVYPKAGGAKRRRARG